MSYSPDHPLQESKCEGDRNEEGMSGDGEDIEGNWRQKATRNGHKEEWRDKERKER